MQNYTYPEYARPADTSTTQRKVCQREQGQSKEAAEREEAVEEGQRRRLLNEAGPHSILLLLARTYLAPDLNYTSISSRLLISTMPYEGIHAHRVYTCAVCHPGGQYLPSMNYGRTVVDEAEAAWIPAELLVSVIGLLTVNTRTDPYQGGAPAGGVAGQTSMVCVADAPLSVQPSSRFKIPESSPSGYSLPNASRKLRSETRRGSISMVQL